MYKKTPYSAYYFATVHDVTPGQLKSLEILPEIDISGISSWMEEKEIGGVSILE